MSFFYLPYHSCMYLFIVVCTCSSRASVYVVPGPIHGSLDRIRYGCQTKHLALYTCIFPEYSCPQWGQHFFLLQGMCFTMHHAWPWCRTSPENVAGGGGGGSDTISPSSIPPPQKKVQLYWIGVTSYTSPTSLTDPKGVFQPPYTLCVPAWLPNIHYKGIQFQF